MLHAHCTVQPLRVIDQQGELKKGAIMCVCKFSEQTNKKTKQRKTKLAPRLHRYDTSGRTQRIMKVF